MLENPVSLWRPTQINGNSVDFAIEEFGSRLPSGTEVVVDKAFENRDQIFYRLKLAPESDILPSSFDDLVGPEVVVHANDFYRALGTNSVATSCYSCRWHGFGGLCEIEALQPSLEVIADSMSNVRSPAQIDQYMDCMLANATLAGDGHSQYFSNYRTYIQSASEAFGVPAQLLQCIFLKESQYNKDIRESEVRNAKGEKVPGAQGLCQIMNGTRKDVNTIIKEGRNFEKREEEYSAKLRDDNQLSNSNRRYMTIKLRQVRQYRNWKTYFSNQWYRDLHGSSVPNSFSNVGRKRPENCIGAAALILREKLWEISDGSFSDMNFDQLTNNRAGDNDPNAARNLMLIMGASYNAGSGGRVGDVIRNADPQTLEEIARQLKTNPAVRLETQNYLQSLENCLTPGNFEGPVGFFGSSPRPDCNEQKAAEQNITNDFKSNFTSWP